MIVCVFVGREGVRTPVHQRMSCDGLRLILSVSRVVLEVLLQVQIREGILHVTANQVLRGQVVPPVMTLW